MDTDTESELVSLVTQLLSPRDYNFSDWVVDITVRRSHVQIISVMRSMELESQPKPESEFMSLVTQMISLCRSTDLASHPKPLSELIQFVSQNKKFSRYASLLRETLELEPEPELMSLIYQLFSLVISMHSSKWEKLVSLCPQVEVKLEQGKFQVGEALRWRSNRKWACLPFNWQTFSSAGEDATHFHCHNCNGENHKEYNKAPVETKHAFHPKHSLRLVFCHLLKASRRCSCCNEGLEKIFYYCSVCDFAINLACAEKPPVLLSVDRPRWHDHTLAFFPRKDSITCDACALTQSSGVFYTCPPCDFVIHQSCLSLPCVIRISRHPHRISYTPYFRYGDWYCGVCRTKIINKFGGYSCIKDGCSYAAHSKCATQRNIWDGEELEGVPEDGEEEVMEPPFVRISDGIIQHFSHQHHHLRLDENTGKDYHERKQCQACIIPIYFGNFYSCMQCDFILHEKCANLSRKIYHPIHPHQLTLVGRYEGVLDFEEDVCSACDLFCKAGFFYECGKKGCDDFNLHVPCATISEPLVHESHMHPLFLTSKPGHRRHCSVYEERQVTCSGETFNCIECNFSLCFVCATLPQKVRYKHDKHTLTLSYGKNTTTMTSWCEVCEKKIEQGKPFYMCDEYCCVTIHIECMFGASLDELCIKAGSLVLGIYGIRKVTHVLPNNHHMSRPFCFVCHKRCPCKIAFQCSGLMFCSRDCMFRARMI